MDAPNMIECENGQKVLVKYLPQPYRSAPELLEALRAAETWLSGWASAEPYLTRIRAAIAAATGEG